MKVVVVMEVAAMEVVGWVEVAKVVAGSVKVAKVAAG